MVNNKIQAAEENLIHVYNRFPVVLDHGEGMYLYDTDGKEYLDFAAGFAVTGLGYDNKQTVSYFQSLLSRELRRGGERAEPGVRHGPCVLYKQRR